MFIRHVRAVRPTADRAQEVVEKNKTVTKNVGRDAVLVSGGALFPVSAIMFCRVILSITRPACSLARFVHSLATSKLRT